MFQRPGSSSPVERSDNNDTALASALTPGEQNHQGQPTTPNDVGDLLIGTTNGHPARHNTQTFAQGNIIESAGIATTTGTSSGPLATGGDEVSPATNGNSVANITAPNNALNNDDGLNHTNRLFLRRSPAGFHITNVPRFMQSPLCPPPGQLLSQRKYVDDHNTDPLRAVTGFNLSRVNDRICKACFTWFRVGEHVFQNPDNFNAFHQRPPTPLQTPKEMLPYIQIQMDGYCGPVCHKVMKRARSDKRIRQICEEANTGHGCGWRRILFRRKIPVPPEGFAVLPANEVDQQAGIKIVFLTKDKH